MELALLPPPLIDDAFTSGNSFQEWSYVKPVPPIMPILFPEQSHTWHAHVQGSCVRVYRKDTNPLPVEPPKRNPVTVFTAEARMRLFRYLNRLDWTNIPVSLFLTLTYPETVPYLRFKERNTHRTRFWRYLEDYYQAKVPAIWRCEWKPRLSGARVGRLAPHVHLIAFNVRNIPIVRLRHLWNKAIMHKGYSNVHAALVVGHQGALRYLAKYVSKELPLGKYAYLDGKIEVGRHWGVVRRSLLPLAPIVCDKQLSDEEVGSLQAIYMGIKEWYDPTINGGFTMLGDELTAESLNNLGK